MSKIYLDEDVNSAATYRIQWVLERFEHICVSFSGGKDSTVLLDKVGRCAQELGRTVDVLFIDWEAQYRATIDHVAQVLAQPWVVPHWVCLPMTTCNESSFHDPLWTAWHPEERARWVRALPEQPGVISDPTVLPFYRFGMTFEEFVPAWNQWFEETHGPTAFFIGIRSDESLNRYRAIKGGKNRRRFQNVAWSTQVAPHSYAFYPIYDWRVEDDWIYIGREGIPYNRIYDHMYLLGMKLHDMRICEPYSREARKHLNKYAQLEPDTWAKVVERTGGANFGARYGGSELFGFRHISKPGHLTWKQYAELLLETLPGPLREHYRRRIMVFREWFHKHKGWTDLKEESDLDLEMRNLGGSWRMVCRTLLRNDYFCTHLSFSVNQDEFQRMEVLKNKYKDL